MCSMYLCRSRDDLYGWGRKEVRARYFEPLSRNSGILMNKRVLPFVQRLLQHPIPRGPPRLASREFNTAFPRRISHRTLDSAFLATLISDVECSLTQLKVDIYQRHDPPGPTPSAPDHSLRRYPASSLRSRNFLDFLGHVVGSPSIKRTPRVLGGQLPQLLRLQRHLPGIPYLISGRTNSPESRVSK